MRVRRLAAVTLALLVIGGLAGIALFSGVWPITSSSEPLQVRPAIPRKAASPDEFVTLVYRLINRTERPLELDLRAELPQGWTLLEEPPAVSLPPGAEEEVFITFNIPPMTPAGRYELSLAASASGEPPYRAVGVTTVSVRREAKVHVRLLVPQRQARPGASVKFPLLIANYGNTTATFVILSRSGWRLLGTHPLRLAPGQRQEVEVGIQVPQVASSGRYELPLQVSAGRHSKEVRLYVIVPPGY